jgi:iron complex outermembrane receptor protein
VPLVADNRMVGRVVGFEANAKWQATRWARFELTYSFLDMHLTPLPGSGDVTSKRSEGQSPPHQLGLRGSFDLPRAVEVDGMFRYVDALSSLALPGYAQLDLRLGWRPRYAWELALVGQNLLHHRLTEYNSNSLLTARSIQVYRAVYVSLTFRH